MIHFDQITTIKDPKIVLARTLVSSVGRTVFQKCLLEGSENIERGIEAHMHIEHVFYHMAARDDRFIARLMQRDIPCYGMSDGILKKVTHTSQVFPYIGVAALPPPLGDSMDNVVLVVEHVQSHYVLGSLIRAASALGIRDILSTDTHLDLFFRKIVSASEGKVFEARVRRFTSGSEVLELLTQKGYRHITTSPLSRDFEAIALFQKDALTLE